MFLFCDIFPRRKERFIIISIINFQFMVNLPRLKIKATLEPYFLYKVIKWKA